MNLHATFNTCKEALDKCLMGGSEGMIAGVIQEESASGSGTVWAL